MGVVIQMSKLIADILLGSDVKSTVIMCQFILGTEMSFPTLKFVSVKPLLVNHNKEMPGMLK